MFIPRRIRAAAAAIALAALAGCAVYPAHPVHRAPPVYYGAPAVVVTPAPPPMYRYGSPHWHRPGPWHRHHHHHGGR